MRISFLPALERLFAAEEGSPSTKTRFGLSKRVLASWKGCKVAEIDLSEVEKGLAAAILDMWFWRAVHADELPEGLDEAMFRRAVKKGPKQAIYDLQFALRIRPDGVITGRLIRAAEREVPEITEKMAA